MMIAEVVDDNDNDGKGDDDLDDQDGKGDDDQDDDEEGGRALATEDCDPG